MQVTVSQARQLCQAVFDHKLGCPPQVAELAVDAIVEANLRGIDSHGIQVLPYYLDKWSVGQINPEAELEVVRELPASAVFDAHQGLGHYVSWQVMQSAISRAKTVGIAASVVRNSTHNGAISHYTIQAARQGMIGIAGTACAPHVAPFGGTAGLHGTNPISYAFPRGASDPLVFDCSTGHSAAKMKSDAERTGVLPAERLIDESGQPTTNPADLKNGWILPVAGHLGFGFGLLVDGLTAALADSPIGRQMPLVSETSSPYHGAFFALAISPAAFAGLDPFTDRLNNLVGQIESHRPQDPQNPVRWPGQRGWDTRRQRLQSGIPVSDANWRQLVSQLEGYEIELGRDAGG